MSALGGLNRPPNGVVIGLAQLQLPVGATPAAGPYWLAWEDQVVHTDGTSCGFPKPSRKFGQTLAEAAERTRAQERP